MIILGIDPGLQATGYGFIAAEADHLNVVTAGDLRPPRHEPLAERLGFLHRGLSELVGRYRPQAVVLEKIFTHHAHVTTAALMAHARGVACLVTQQHGIAMAEYLPTHVKKSLTGNGAASKDQVARMVRQWLSHAEPSWSRDATDALALAIVHAHAQAARRNLPEGLLAA